MDFVYQIHINLISAPSYFKWSHCDCHCDKLCLQFCLLIIHSVKDNCSCEWVILNFSIYFCSGQFPISLRSWHVSNQLQTSERHVTTFRSFEEEPLSHSNSEQYGQVEERYKVEYEYPYLSSQISIWTRQLQLGNGSIINAYYQININTRSPNSNRDIWLNRLWYKQLNF